MAPFTRDELEAAFTEYQRVAAECGRTGDWNAWADLFTEDARYVEHLFGEMHGRESIREWIVRVMGEFPGNAMPEFPIEWSILDPERGWIACKIWNRMEDPGDGSVHEAANLTLLKYAGDGLWAYEEDAYNPDAFRSMIAEWSAVKQAHTPDASG